MTKKQLIEVIRKVVRQEVKKQVDEIFIQEKKRNCNYENSNLLDN